MLKYGLYGAAALWMFALGVMVGRGNAPITFDTTGFQARLEAIALTSGRKTEEKVDLKFYDALNQPVQHAVKGRKRTAGEIVPDRESLETQGAPPADTGVADTVPVKVGKKQSSMNPDLQKRAAAAKAAAVPEKAEPQETAAPEQKPPRAEKKVPEAAAEKPGSPGMYTIQVAAFKAFKDAVSQMAALEQKGISAYRIKGEKNGAVWYRVRTGSFPDYNAAKSRLEELKQAKIDGMIIKKEER